MKRDALPLMAVRRQQLGRLLADQAPFWRPQPFKETVPSWCKTAPALADALSALSSETVTAFTADTETASAWLAQWLPGLPEIDSLCAMPAAGESSDQSSPRARCYVPGRKDEQIAAFVSAVGTPAAPLVEWCAGKGHLGRRFASAFGVAARAVDIDPRLCRAGESLARRAGVRQDFVVADIHQPEALASLHGGHLIALHACGDLHRRLLVAAVSERVSALDVAPCCYQRSADSIYQPLAQGASLGHLDETLLLTRADLQLAVTETVTAAPREARASARLTALKLAFVALRESLAENADYQPFRPVPPAWSRLAAADFLCRLAQREGLRLPETFDATHWETVGENRWQAMRRFQLVRAAFRRAIEVWLLLDMAAFLEANSYVVRLREFCPRSVTPRNLLLSARLL